MSNPAAAVSVATMSDEEVEALYAHGHGLFTMKRYPQALQVLTVAMLLRPKALHCMIAVGLAYRMLGQDAHAMAVFQMAVMLHPSRLEPRVHLADCALLSGQTGLALDCARDALRCPLQGGTFEAPLRQRAQVILERGRPLARPAVPAVSKVPAVPVAKALS